MVNLRDAVIISGHPQSICSANSRHCEARDDREREPRDNGVSPISSFVMSYSSFSWPCSVNIHGGCRCHLGLVSHAWALTKVLEVATE
ncbi:hypothetical protein EUTSA_v10005204mg [Eutrema salsugineum]|uniref:Uncharacterized protein n=1 Tax=Eutrema salsugineum TaxID=72664 RepID=V4KPJ7_EUTSA|nr:hypothetical protein EUTSA_v10005204mg [Eutrema salsugineum]